MILTPIYKLPWCGIRIHANKLLDLVHLIWKNDTARRDVTLNTQPDGSILPSMWGTNLKPLPPAIEKYRVGGVQIKGALQSVVVQKGWSFGDEMSDGGIFWWNFEKIITRLAKMGRTPF